MDANAAPVLSLDGVSSTVPPVVTGFPVFLIFWLTTEILPVPSVEIDATYCEVGTDDSQPQALAPGKETDDDWIVSVMEVRQPDAARMTSEFLARIV